MLLNFFQFSSGICYSVIKCLYAVCTGGGDYFCIVITLPFSILVCLHRQAKMSKLIFCKILTLEYGWGGEETTVLKQNKAD